MPRENVCTVNCERKLFERWKRWCEKRGLIMKHKVEQMIRQEMRKK